MSKQRKSEETKQAEILACLKELFIKCGTNVPFLLKDELKGVAVTHVQTAINRLQFIKRPPGAKGKPVVHTWTGESPAIMAVKVYAMLNELLKEYEANDIAKRNPGALELQLIEKTETVLEQQPAQDNSEAIDLLKQLLQIQMDSNEKITLLFNSLK